MWLKKSQLRFEIDNMGVSINADNLANVGYFYGKVIKGNYRDPFSLAFSTALTGLKDLGSIIDNLKQ